MHCKCIQVGSILWCSDRSINQRPNTRATKPCRNGKLISGRRRSKSDHNGMNESLFSYHFCFMLITIAVFLAYMYIIVYNVVIHYNVIYI